MLGKGDTYWLRTSSGPSRTITVEGRIIDTKRLESICFLNFTKEGGASEHFYLVVFKDQFEDFGGAPEQYFLNKTVRVTGVKNEETQTIVPEKIEVQDGENWKELAMKDQHHK